MDAAVKQALRQQVLLARGQGGDADSATARLITELAPYVDGVLAGYWPMRDELDPRPAMAAHRGPICLPVTGRRGQPLIFRQWRGEELERGPLGTWHPGADCAELRPRVLIVPLAGFDRRGNRLGYGAGFYDRTLDLLRAAGPVTAIGFAFAVQELPDIPAEPTDQPLNLIVTDRETIRP